MSAAGLTARRVFGRAAAHANRVRPSLVVAILDVCLVVLSVAAALMLRYDGSVSAEMWPKAAVLAVVAGAVFVVWSRVFGVYGQVWAYASAREARQLLATGAASAGTLTVIAVFMRYAAEAAPPTLAPSLLSGDPLPRSVPLVASVLATGLIGLTRYHSRLFARRRIDALDPSPRALIVGAGELGVWLVRQFRETGSFVPVGFVDDDPGKGGRRYCGVRVVGTSDEIASLVPETGADEVIVAVGRPETEMLLAVAQRAREAGATVKVVPSASEIILKGMRPDDLRSLDTAELLGRASVRPDLTGVEHLLADAVVLVTGAGGSIGSEIARQVAAAGPRRLLILDNDETHLHDVTQDLPAEICVPLLADIRDESRIRRLMATHRPSIVFHAAAHKHVPILEAHPCEALLTNVLGTRSLLRAAQDVDVARFILISTDKAVAPSSVMGASKRIAEYLVDAAAVETGRPYASVRFGNVLGSRGSVVPTFTRQISQGGPVTVTDRRMERFFMTIPEATHLVLQASGLAHGGGEVFMLDMGDPVPIVSLAEQMIRASGRVPGVDIEIRVTGTRPGEKLSEQLVEDTETVAPTRHPSLRQVTPRFPDAVTLAEEIDHLRALCSAGDDEEVGRHLLAFARRMPTPTAQRVDEPVG